MADNVSSGVEPVFALAYTRKVTQPDGSKVEEEVSDYALRRFRALQGEDAPLPAYFVTAQDLTPAEHVRMQAAVQRHVDSAISKTVNVPEDISFEAFQAVYLDAYRSGCKGCTTYRPNAITGSVLEVKPAEPSAATAVSDRASQDQDTDLMVRPEKMIGATYKLRWPDSEHAMYVTVNDIEQDGVPPAVRGVRQQQEPRTLRLGRGADTDDQRGVPPRRRGRLRRRGTQAGVRPARRPWTNGRYVGSLVAAIGDVIERHMIDTGFLTPAEPIVPKAAKPRHRPPRPRLDPCARNAANPAWCARPDASAVSIAAGPNAADREEAA